MPQRARPQRDPYIGRIPQPASLLPDDFGRSQQYAMLPPANLRAFSCLPLAHFDTERLESGNISGEARQRLAPAAAHSNKKCIATRLAQNAVDSRDMSQGVFEQNQLLRGKYRRRGADVGCDPLWVRPCVRMGSGGRKGPGSGCCRPLCMPSATHQRPRPRLSCIVLKLFRQHALQHRRVTRDFIRRVIKARPQEADEWRHLQIA